MLAAGQADQPSRPPLEGAVAVIPFSNLSERPDHQWVGAGIAETVSSDLSRLGLPVLAQGTVSAVLTNLGRTGADAGSDADSDNAALRETLRELGVAWLVDGAVQHVGPLVRVTARVVDVRTGTVVHAARVDGTMQDLFQAQDEIAMAIAQPFAVFAPGGDAPMSSPGFTATPPLTPRPSPAPTTQSRTDVTGELVLEPPSSPRGRVGSGSGVSPVGEGPATFAIRTSEPPNIDGRLDDPVWARATHITDFVQMAPAAGTPASEETEVWIAYDDDNLYFAFYAPTETPGLCGSTGPSVTRYAATTQMAVLFDTFLDQQRAYQFQVNGYGVQADSIVNAGQTSVPSRRSVGPRSSGGTSRSSAGSSSRRSLAFGIRGDDSWNALFHTGGRRVEDGWTAEMAIPFKSLRYPSRPDGVPHRWGFQITRIIREKSESVAWAPGSLSISGQLTQMGVLDGLENLSTSRNLEFLPTVTAARIGSLDTENGTFEAGDPDADAGIGIKYGVTPNLTADLTYNPDFSQIESDRPQIATNQRFALFYPEQRPFFLEGQEIFNTATQADIVHTRAIIDPRFGEKLTGKVGSTTVGIVAANDEAPGNFDDSFDPLFGKNAQFFLGRARYDFYSESYLGVIGTNRQFDNDYNRVGGIDGRFRLGQTHSVSFLAVGSDHRDELEGELQGAIFEVEFNRRGRSLGYGITHSGISPDFRTESGFVPRVDTRLTTADVSYRWWPEAALISWGPSVRYLRNHNHEGDLDDEQIGAQVDFDFQRNLRFSGAVSRDLERFGGIDFRKTGYSFFTVISQRVASIVVSANWGDGVFFSDDPFLGKSTGGNFLLSFRPTSRLRAELTGVLPQIPRSPRGRAGVQRPDLPSAGDLSVHRPTADALHPRAQHRCQDGIEQHPADVSGQYRDGVLSGIRRSVPAGRPDRGCVLLDPPV